MANGGRRRIILAAGALLAPTLARAQKMPVIGFLNGAAYELSADLVRSFHRGLAETGYAEGRNVAFEYRSAEGHYDRLPALAADLVQHRVDVIAATGTPTGLPAKAATKTIPIVFVTGSDPIQQGLVNSLSRPDGNLTGATTLAVEMGRKRLELLHELAPKASIVGALLNPTGPNLEAVTLDLQAASRAIGLPIRILHASTEQDFDKVFAALAQIRAGGLIVGVDTFFNSQSRRLGALTLQHRVPAIYQYRDFAAAGGLVSFGGSIIEAYREAGVYAGRILKGAKPAELPIQQSTRAELFVNQKTAQALGITIPPSILARADEVIQ